MAKGDKYIALNRYLQSQKQHIIALTFKDIEKIIHQKLPPSAYQHNAWWGNHEGNSQATAWLEANYKVHSVSQNSSIPSVVFISTRYIKPIRETPQLDWFNLNLIKETSNADQLFMALLEFLQTYQLNPYQTFTIKAIEYFIPRGTRGISTNSVYGFSMMSMFSNQRNRDYFIFESQHLSELFKETCMSQNRDNFLWRKTYELERCRINPKYIKLAKEREH